MMSMPVLDTVIMGNARLYEIMQGKGCSSTQKKTSLMRMGSAPASWKANLLTMNGWEAESDAATLLNGLGIDTDLHYTVMKELTRQ